jgi:uncharacterized Zn-binding protein involved in type VI secretion
MSKPAARVGDMVLQSGPHCHAPMHPPAPVPTPTPHPALPLALLTGCMTVLIGNQPAATMTSQTTPCLLPGCVPGGPGMVSLGSSTVLIGNLPAARVGDMTLHSTCVFPIPAPVGTIQSPGCSTVLIGG